AVKKNSTERTATSATEHDPFIAPPPEFEILTDAARAISTEPKILPTERTIGDLNICVKGEVPPFLLLTQDDEFPYTPPRLK
ncbi:MAG: hypothetical protein NTV04_00615, partial [Deltaproteobacteria bacterium]|nr:hypothetical protein [Deltaproteobacteria bacterium]